MQGGVTMAGRARWAGLLVGLVCAVSLAACGAGGAEGDSAGPSADLTELSAETEALAQIGFATDVAALRAAAPDPSASAKVGKRMEDRKLRRLRQAFGKGTLHAEATVETRDGVRTLVVQRGEVTAVDGDSVTVKSSDGFSLTWSFGENVRIGQRGAPGGKADKSALKAGVTVGVAGQRTGDSTVARLIIIPGEKATK
jgi:hypothetical protein